MKQKILLCISLSIITSLLLVSCSGSKAVTSAKLETLQASNTDLRVIISGIEKTKNVPKEFQSENKPGVTYLSAPEGYDYVIVYAAVDNVNGGDISLLSDTDYVLKNTALVDLEHNIYQMGTFTSDYRVLNITYLFSIPEGKQLDKFIFAYCFKQLGSQSIKKSTLEVNLSGS
jgi:hypothetical protein